MHFKLNSKNVEKSEAIASLKHHYTRGHLSDFHDTKILDIQRILTTVNMYNNKEAHLVNNRSDINSSSIIYSYLCN